MATATITISGTIQLPVEVVSELHLQPGALLSVRVEHGRIILQTMTEPPFENLLGHFAFLGGGTAEELQKDRRGEESTSADRWRAT